MEAPARPDERHSGVDRREILKAGAIAGAAGVVVASGLGRLNSSPQSLARSPEPAPGRTPASLDDFLSMLVHQKTMMPFTTVDSFYVPPNSSFLVTHSVEPGYVSVVTEDRITVERDHELKISIKVDGSPVVYDPDVVQSRYAQPINLLHSSSFHPIRESFVMSIANKTSRTNYFASMLSGGKIPSMQCDAILQEYFA